MVCYRQYQLGLAGHRIRPARPVFAMGVFGAAASFRELQRPEFALRHFIRLAAAKVAVSRGMEIMTAIFNICGGVVNAALSGIGGAVSTATTIPAETEAAAAYLKKLNRLTVAISVAWNGLILAATSLFMQVYALEPETKKLVFQLVVIHNVFNAFAYVAMTRAQKGVYITNYGKESFF